jgi:hypothetical protein
MSLSRNILRWIPVACMALATCMAHSQSLPAGVRLGMTADELHVVQPTLERVARPQRLAGGLAGVWHGAPDQVAGLVFEPTYFLAGASLRRVEFVSSAQAQPDFGADAYRQIVAWGRGAFGPELASNDGGSEIAAWVDGDVDVYAQRTGDPRHATVRLVYRTRVLKDASQL